MVLFPQTMLKTTIITPIEDFPKLLLQLAETDKFMPRETSMDEELEDYYPISKLDSLRRMETSIEDLLKLLPEPKEKLKQKIARAYKKQPMIEPLFENWEDIDIIEEQISEEIDKIKSEVTKLTLNKEKIESEIEMKELISKGFRLLEAENPYQVTDNERALIGVLTTSKLEDAEEFISNIEKTEVIPLISNKFLIFAQGRKGEISRLVKNLSTVRWIEHTHSGPIHLNKVEIESELENDIADAMKELEVLEDKSKQFTIQNKERILALRLSIESYRQILRIYVTAKKTRKTAIFQGWIAQKDEKSILQSIADFSETVLETEKPEGETKNIPIVESKSAIMRAFHSIVGLYGLPSANEVDPTIFVIFTFICRNLQMSLYFTTTLFVF